MHKIRKNIHFPLMSKGKRKQKRERVYRQGDNVEYKIT